MSEIVGFVVLGALTLVGGIVSLVGTLSSLKNEHRLTKLETIIEGLECRKNGCIHKES